jgi:phospholipase C
MLNRIPLLVLTSLSMLVEACAAQNKTPIEHVVFIIKENRSFDSYFGTFPGAKRQLPI